MPKMPMEDKKWRAEEDLRSLRRAMEMQQDKERFSAVKQLVKKEIAALSKVTKSKVK